MLGRIVALALALGLLALPAAPARAAEVDANALDAVVVVGEADLPALFASGYIGDYALLSAAEVGLDPAALTAPGQLSPDALLTPRDLGLGTSANFLVPFGGLGRFFRGFVVVNRLPVPVFFFRPPALPPPLVLPPPVFPRVAIVVAPPPPPVVLPVALPPPAPLPPPPPRPCCPAPAAVPIIPEADSLPLVGLGLAGLGALALVRWRRQRMG